jgi:hypothetical protein
MLVDRWFERNDTRRPTEFPVHSQSFGVIGESMGVVD